MSDKLDNAWTVRELIDVLQDYDPESKVLFTVNYGDIGNTMQALPVCDCEEVEPIRVQESGYSHSGYEIVDEPERDYSYCDACDRVHNAYVATCPACHGPMLDWDGNEIENGEDDDDSDNFVVLS